MKKLIILIPFFAMTWFLVSCNQSPTKSTETRKETPSTVDAKYSCPMHPEVVSDKPGTCPKCGMDLEKVTK